MAVKLLSGLVLGIHLCIGTGMAAAISSSLLNAAAEVTDAKPHPDLPGRLVVEQQGITVEYSPGLERYVPFVVKEALLWHERQDAKSPTALKPATPLPLSLQDFQENRTAILQQIASAIGLDQPTELQSGCYDAMLVDLERLNIIQSFLGEMWQRYVKSRHYSIWEVSELAPRLKAGEKILGGTWDEARQDVAFSFDVSAKIELSPEEKAEWERTRSERMEHSFDTSVDANGHSQISASFTLGPNKRGAPNQLPSSRLSEKLQQALSAAPKAIVPFLIYPEDAAKSTEQIARDGVGRSDQFVELAEKEMKLRDATLAMTMLHETVEIGILERYIGSSDRRWICDGTANYVSMKLMRDRAGEDFAREGYDLSEQLTQYAALQPKIKLRAWAAGEQASVEEGEKKLSDAHYAFATRAVVMIAEKHGDDFLPKLFREVGKTPRENASAATFAKAYRTLTGNNLDVILSAAEKRPLAPIVPVATP